MNRRTATLRRGFGLLMVITLLGLTAAGCARVQSHFALPDLAMADPAQYRETMTTSGCEVSTFRPVSPLVLLSPFGFGRDNNRSHRRILVVDGRVGFTGGVGVSPK